MPALALFDALQDFAPRRTTSMAPQTQEMPRPDASATRAMPNIDAIVAERVAIAQAALRAELEEQHAAELAELADRHAAILDQLSRDLGERAGATISRTIGDAEARIRDHAITAMARAVGGILSEELQKRSLERLAITIRDAMNDREALRVRVRGPQSLFEPLRKAMGGHAEKLDFAEAPGFDLTVALDGELIETRLAEWSSSLSEILA